MQPLKRGDGLANIFAKIYNLLKLQFDEDKKQYELMRDFEKLKYNEEQRRKNRGFLGSQPEAKRTATKEEEPDHKSFFTKVFGALMTGITSIIGGLVNIILSPIKFLAGMVWHALGLIKTLALTIGEVSIFLVGKMKKLSEFLMEKFLEHVVKRGLMGGQGGFSGGKKALKRGAAGLGAFDLAKEAYFGETEELKKDVKIGAIGATAAGALGATALSATGYGLAAIGIAGVLSPLAQQYQDYVRYMYGDEYLEEKAKRERELSKKIKSIPGPAQGDPFVSTKKEYYDTIQNYQKIDEKELDKIKENYQKTTLTELMEKAGFKPAGKNQAGDLQFADKSGRILSDEELFLHFELQKFKESWNPLAGLEENETYKKIVGIPQTAMDYAKDAGKLVLSEIESISDQTKKFGNQTGEILSNLFKELGVNTNNAQIMQPIVKKDSQTIPIPSKEGGRIQDFSIRIRNDDPTMISIQKQNLRPI
jgi:hypothetical protein